MIFQHESIGLFESRYENQKKWKKRFFKIMGKKLCCFLEGEEKADKIFNLPDCTSFVSNRGRKDLPDISGDDTEEQFCIWVEDGLQFGCVIKFENSRQLSNTLNTFRRYCKS